MKTELEALRDLKQNECPPATVLRDFLAHLGYDEIVEAFDEVNVRRPVYLYSAQVTRVVDGDTVDVCLDLGCHVKIHRRLRLIGVDTWEVRGRGAELGKAARDWLVERINGLGNRLVIETEMDAEGKYGRLLARMYSENGDDLNAEIHELWEKQDDFNN